MTNVKPWYQSKTVWVNALIVGVAALDAFRLLPNIPPDWGAYALAVGGVLNVVLRLTTSQGIAGFVPPAPAAGPPSLAEELAADYQRRGDLSPDPHPEDTV